MPQNPRPSSTEPARRAPGPAPRPRPPVDAIDQRLVALLQEDGRMANNALAAEVGISPSTCLSRVRSLRERGVIRGFHADVDPAALGRPVQAVIKVRLGAHSRDQIEQFRAKVDRLPGVLALFHLSGADDYLLHVAMESTDALRDFVLDHLTADRAVTHAETSMVFEHVRRG